MISLDILLLILIANGVPVMACALFNQRFGLPLDMGARFFDGRPLFGPSKTLRGLLLSLPLTGIAAELIGLSFMLGLTVALWAMLGDLLSSLIKRRLGMKPGSQALGLDQLPESLLPLLAVAGPLAISATEIMATVITFIVLELLISRVLFRLKLRKHPY
ncbi:MAG: CDP-archaeol synthase [Mariprofundaceae bacterium]|nr:CDP-archaeol synthase [Mariprofundaceae bacterium]